MLDDVIRAALRNAKALVAADGYAIWRLTPNGIWRIESFDGVSATFANLAISRWNDAGVATVPFTDPLVVEDVYASPLLSDRAPVYREEGIQSMLALPLGVTGAAAATLTLYYRTTHHFTEVEVEMARALGNLAALALTTAELYDEQRRTRESSAFLAQASAALADSLDFETTLNTVARLAVPGVADSCAIHLIDEQGQIRLVASVHVDPTKASVMHTLAEPTTSTSSRTWLRTIRDGTSALLADIDQAMAVRALAGDERLLRAFAEVRFTSQISVPLLARGRTLGGITFALGPGTRRYDAVDLRLAEDLAHRAAIAVDNARLYTQASDANRLKDEFLATLSHELRTPLNAILGYARMLRGGILTEPAKKERAVEILERNAQALTEMVEDILDISRIISGKMRLNISDVNLSAVLDDAVVTILPAAEAKGVAVEVAIDRTVPPVSGDAERLRQIVWNLLSNATKFTSRGGVVRLELRQTASDAIVSVSDTGRGIAPDFLPHLFERFRQAQGHHSREHGGLGLGLAIARELVETHGGTIHAMSGGEGQGATFTVTLPLAAATTRAQGVGVPEST